MANDQKKQIFPANEYIFKEGSRSSAAYLILDGQVEIRLGAFGEHPKSLATLGKGDVIGEMSLFDDAPHMASALAVEKTTVGVLSGEEFKQRMEKMDPLMRGILKIMVKRLRQMGEGQSIKSTKANWDNWQK